MGTADLLFDCLDSLREIKPDADKFEQTICPLCKNMNCVRAGRGDLFAKRVATQPGRFFNPERADPNSSRYAGLVDFEDRLAQEMIQIIASRRGDWVIPEIPVLDGKVDQVDQARSTPAENATDPPATPEESPVKVPLPPAGKVHHPQAGNTPNPPGGIMIGGAEKPSHPRPPVDLWTPPASTQVQVSKPGACVQFGSDGTVIVTSPETKKP